MAHCVLSDSWLILFFFSAAPFASDLKNIERYQKDVKALEVSKPFNPVEQLMAVLPSDSAHAIPKAARWLMCDHESPIIDFYPKDVPVDPNGKAMPWLWVVLLPFIEEDRLLDAMMPTMAKWTKDELLCNARGMDDGYLYVHKSGKICAKLRNVLAKGKSATSPKTRLGNASSYGFSGSVRPPLSNELYPVDEEVKIILPPGADKIEYPGADGLFVDDLEINDCVCVAFSEPNKLPHKSVLLPGARPPPSILTEADKRIRRPRLGRGGSIANMGGSHRAGNSHQSGYGSMNISSYERDLASRTGRGNELNQAGTRSWGAMEPTPKQRRMPQNAPPPPPQQPNPFMNQPGHYQQRSHPNPQAWNQHYQQQQQQYQGQRGHPPNHWQQQQHQRSGYPPNGGHHQQQHRGGYNGGPRPGGQYHAQQQQQQRPQQGFSFRNQNFGAAPPRAPANQPRSRASADAMQSLRAQLSSTLKNKNRKTG